ncbi:MAG: DNA topoisomerase 3 [Muribaculaceae bacterium]|nr:DNA topoisomerase 3 [Muribaculaceae bacterium]
MIVCITEKPSVARDIAQILGADRRQDGFYEGGEYCVTWTFGHLCTLKEPHDYTSLWKRWSLGALPMIPPKFGIKLIDDKGIKHQFDVIKNLMSRADRIINCGDAGQEGELIQRWVMQLAGVTCPVERLWISSLTDESIRRGFSELKPQSDFDNLYYAGLSRAIGDWILGMNGTRLYTIKYAPSQGTVLSVGRVQTPTLALVVERQRQIANFKSEDYWEISTKYRDTTFSLVSGKFTDQSKAEALMQSIASASLTITDVSQKTGKEGPKRLFDLTSLQVECNRLWGWSADLTLKLIQSLYEKKVTTYPRVDTTYLSSDLYPKIPGILKQMTPYANITAPVLAAKISKSKKIFDDAKVTDHHAIIPTGQSPSVLQGDERKLYHLIALRFIAAFYPDCTFNQTTVKADIAGNEFKASGKVIVNPGWRILFPDKKSNGENEDDTILPEFTIGESGTHEPYLETKTTQPPKPYTEGSLLRAMEGAGRLVDSEELREALKENGIGRPSTRSAIIETLFKRQYIRRERKNIIATQAGCDLIDTITDPMLKSAKLTGIWENRLRRIERGEYAPAEFLDQLKVMVNDIVTNVLSDNSARHILVQDRRKETTTSSKSESKPRSRAPRITKLEQITCPVCGQGHLLKGKMAYGCSRYAEGCSFRADFNTVAADLSPAKVNAAIKKIYKSQK